jgi:NAD(P)-dependent dehydrogenase (short-subunit alcohol dehydrogenase family)
MAQQDLNGRVAPVTGGSRGIGAASVLTLARRSEMLHATARDVVTSPRARGEGAR